MDRELQLVYAFLAAIDRGKAVWTRGDGRNENEQTYFFRGRTGGAIIYPKDWDESPPYILAVTDENGIAVSSWSTEEAEPEFKAALHELYRKAKTSAANSVISSLLTELADEEPF